MEKPKTVSIPIVKTGEVPEGMNDTDAVKSGLASFPQGAKVPIIFGNGEKFSVPAEYAIKEIREGNASLYSELDQEKSIKKEIYGDMEGTAALLGLARGLSLNTSDVLGSALGFAEDIKGIREENPVVSTTAELGALAVPFLGELAAAKMAAKGVAGAAKVAKVSEALGAPISAVSALGKGSSTAVGKLLGDGVASKIVSGAAGGATEGFIIGAGAGIGNTALDQPENASEYLNAALSEGFAGSVFGGVVGAAIPAVAKVAEKTNSVLKNSKDKMSGFLEQVGVKKKQALKALDDDGLNLVVDINNSEIPLTKDAQLRKQEADLLGTELYPEHIDASKEIANKSQKLFRSYGPEGRDYVEQLKRDAEKVQETVSKTITENLGDLKNINSDHELGQVGQATVVKHVDDLLQPAKKEYNDIENRAQLLKVRTDDFVNTFADWASKEDQVTNFGNILNTTAFKNHMRDILDQKNMKGVIKAHQRIRADLRNQLSGAGTKDVIEINALKGMDQYVKNNFLDFAKPWKGDTPEAQKLLAPLYEQAEKDLIQLNKDLRSVDARYAPIKEKISKLKDIVKLPDNVISSAESLFEHFQSTGEITPTEFLKKLRDKDPVTLEAIGDIPGLAQIAKKTQIDDLISGLQTKSGRTGAKLPSGENYVDIVSLHDQYNKLSPEQKNFLFTKAQQAKIEAGINWTMGFQNKGYKVTPYKYLSEGLGDTLSKVNEEAAAGMAGAALGGAVGGFSLAGLATAIAASVVAKEGKRAFTNIMEARTSNKIRNFIGASNDVLSTQAGLVGAIRKSEAKTKKTIVESVNGLIDNFDIDRARVIKSFYKPEHNQPDKTSDELQKRYKEISADLNNIKGNEIGMLDEMINESGSIKDVMPEISAQVAAHQVKVAQYLISMMPKNPLEGSTSPLAKSWKPSNEEIRQFMLVKRSVEQPLSVIDDIKKGVVAPASINALRELYPNIYGDLTQEIKAKVESTDKLISENQKAVLAIVLGGSFDESFDPNFTSKLNVSSSPQQAQPLASSQPAKKLNQTGVQKMKMAQSAQTQTERVTNRA
jgi:hypothetical protein